MTRLAGINGRAVLAFGLLNLLAACGVLAWLLARSGGLALLLVIGLALGAAACMPLLLILKGCNHER